MAIGALGSAGEVGGVGERDGTRRRGCREGDRGRAGCGALGGEAVTLGAGFARIVLGPVRVARETGLSLCRRPGVRDVTSCATCSRVGRRLVQTGPLRMAGRAVRQRLNLLVLLVALVARQARHGRSRRADLVTAAAGAWLRGAARMAGVAHDLGVPAGELPRMGEGRRG